MTKITVESNQNFHLMRNSINYLYELAKNDVVVNSVKSLCRTKALILQRQQGYELKDNERPPPCPRCLLDVTEVPNFHEIKPMKLNTFDKKVLKKNKNMEPLTKYQRNSLKKLKKKYPKTIDSNHNLLVTTCGMCKHKISKCLRKPNKESSKKSVEAPTNNETSTKKKKKKKKRDKFCGLDKKIVQSGKNFQIPFSQNQSECNEKSTTSNQPVETNKKTKLLKNKKASPTIKTNEKNSSIHNKTIKKQTKIKNRGKEKQAIKKHLLALSKVLEKSKKTVNKTSALLDQFLTSL